MPVVREVPDALPRPEGARLFLSLFERFPEAEEEVHWMMLHFIEEIRGYEDLVLQSIDRAPSVFALRMVNRMLAAGMRGVAGKNLLVLLQKLADEPTVPARIRDDAKAYLNRHQR
jgi:hypothetical protein